MMLPVIDLPYVDTGDFYFGEDDPADNDPLAPPIWQTNPDPPDGRPNPQRMALESPAFETLYGGAAGGGKSDLLLGLARLHHNRSLLLRRTFPDLERSLIVRSLEFFGDARLYNGSKHVWRVDGRRIEFGHLEHELTVHQYQSAQYDLIGFDELTQFTQLQYEYMISRIRTVKQGQRTRMVAATNPGGEGNDWVMQRWAAWLDETHPNPAMPGELRYYKRNEDGKEVETTADDSEGISRTFIPARLDDNPHLGDDYWKQLNLLPEPYRSQLLSGDWLVGLVDDAYQVIPRAWVKLAQKRWTAEPPTYEDKRVTRITPMTRLGVDVARGGDDQTILAPRRGKWYAPLIKKSGKDTPDGPTVATLVLTTQGQERPKVNIDVIGIGASAYDHLVGKCRLAGVNFGEGADLGEGKPVTDKSGQLEMANVRAWAWWSMREALDPTTGDNLALPPDSELLGDLCAPHWIPRSGCIYIESKEEIKKRLHRSTDCGDAVVLANFSGAGELPAQQPEQVSRWAKMGDTAANDNGRWRGKF